MLQVLVQTEYVHRILRLNLKDKGMMSVLYLRVFSVNPNEMT